MAQRVAPYRTLCAHTLAALLLIGAASAASHAATYYVAPPPAGSDSNAGSQAAPWATLQKAGDIAQAGDTVVVLPGTYQGFRPRNSGTAQAPIAFRAQAGTVVNAPGAANSNSDNIWVRDVDYIAIDGFESTNAPRAGIAVQGEPDANATGVVIRNCFAHNNGRWGIFTGFARDLLIESNETSFSAAEHGIYVSNSGDNPVVRGNRVHDNNAAGIQLNADPAEMGSNPTDPQGDGIITNALIELNVIHDNGVAGAAAINLASVRSSLIRNNLLYNNHATGIAGWDDGDGNQFGTMSNRIIGNTIVQPVNARFAIGLKDGSIDNTVLDNIVLNAGPRGSLEVDPSSQPGLVSDYNVVIGTFSDDTNFLTLAQWRALGFDPHSIVSSASAVFTNAASNDYHLSATSPARDAGTAVPDLPTDLDGISRPQGPQFDCGAYEYVASGPSPTATLVPSATRTASRTATATATVASTPTASRTASATATSSPTPSATVTAVPTGNSAISGHLLYGANIAVPSATLQLAGPTSTSASSDGNGAFAFGHLADGAWRLTPRKDGDRGNAISALDAAYVLQFVAGLRPLDGAQQLACDVTANGTVSALDATRILQFVVGLLPQFRSATDCGSDWLFLPQPQPAAGQTLVQPILNNDTCQPGAIAYATLPTDVGGQDFRAVLIGDCTGNWRPTAAAAAVRRAYEAAPAIRVTRLRRSASGGLRAVLFWRAAAAFQSAATTLEIDSQRLRLVSARALWGARPALVEFNTSGDTIALALATAAPIAAGRHSGIRLEFAPLADDAARSQVAVGRLALDE
jgi:parallel beta-helix repeat protein